MPVSPVIEQYRSYREIAYRKRSPTLSLKVFFFHHQNVICPQDFMNVMGKKEIC